MGYKMKTVNDVLRLHPSSNHTDNVIRYREMPNKRIFGYIDQNKTIFLNKDLRFKDQVKTIKHEKGHKKQMLEGRLKFDSLFYHFQPKGADYKLKVPTKDIDPRRRDLPWEYEIERNVKRKRK
tara:strand:+ start:1541 stop:1909 length:369 start_codon:yes stop_codon:yes gene_type:complete